MVYFECLLSKCWQVQHACRGYSFRSIAEELLTCIGICVAAMQQDRLDAALEAALPPQQPACGPAYSARASAAWHGDLTNMLQGFTTSSDISQPIATACK
jgi:hypothetical protein